jgi:hypothetical protein
MKIDAPDLSVIDEAIDRIASGKNTYSCLALESAAMARKTGYADAKKYIRQYCMVICGVDNSHEPYWWDMASSREELKKARIQALLKFRQACIDAAKKESA